MNYNINMDNAITESVNDNFINAMLDHLTIRLQWEEFEDTKGIIRIRKSKKDRQLNGQKKKSNRTNTDLQNIYIKLKIESHEPH
jgi:hypothetical protein